MTTWKKLAYESDVVLIANIDDTPVDNETAAPISSNWAYDHVVAADPHTGYRLESADHTHASTGAQAGQLDWDNVWADAVHSHTSDAEGGVLTSTLLDDTAGGTDALTTKAPTSNVMYDHTVSSTKHMDALLTTRGDIIYRNATVPARLAKGAQYTKLAMGADDPQWQVGSLYVPLATAANVYYFAAVSSSPRTATISSVSGQAITLTANVAYKFWNAVMASKARIKIYNTTRSQSAWVEGSTAVNKLTIKTGDDITAWVNGDNITTANDGAASTYTDVEDILSTIPAGAVGIYTNAFCKDTGTIADAKGLVLAPGGTATGATIVAPQVSSVLNASTCIIPLTAAKIFAVSDRATGTDTMTLGMNALGYFI